MFFGSDREALVREMFIAGELARRERGPADASAGGHAAASRPRSARLAEIQRSDFVALLGAMEGAPVTIRLLDPPLHEFIGPAVFERELSAAEARGTRCRRRGPRAIEIARELEEVNPMLGTRGARLGLHLGGIYEMQARAIAEAALEVAPDGGSCPSVEVMIPLVAFPAELRALRAAVEAAIAEILGERQLEVGTMIELPAACLAADEIAAERRVLQLRHQRPDPDGPRALPRRCRAGVPAGLSRARDRRDEPVRDDRRARGRRARRDRDRARPRGEAVAEAGRLRRAWRRPGQHRVLPPRRARLRELLSVPRPDRQGRGGAGGDPHGGLSGCAPLRTRAARGGSELCGPPPRSVRPPTSRTGRGARSRRSRRPRPPPRS